MRERLGLPTLALRERWGRVRVRREQGLRAVGGVAFALRDLAALGDLRRDLDRPRGHRLAPFDGYHDDAQRELAFDLGAVLGSEDSKGGSEALVGEHEDGGAGPHGRGTGRG